jgi:hypothetical protein
LSNFFGSVIVITTFFMQCCITHQSVCGVAF